VRSITKAAAKSAITKSILSARPTCSGFAVLDVQNDQVNQLNVRRLV
jgi:hypothetical protein